MYVKGVIRGSSK